LENIEQKIVYLHQVFSSFLGASSRLTKTITKQKRRDLFSAYQDRGRKMIDSRRLWITQIKALIRWNSVYYNSNKLIHNLYNSQLLLNHKIVVQITILNRNFLYLM
ncbi:hypothetical protein I3760_07G076400, partial [Carya illinoinensis]